MRIAGLHTVDGMPQSDRDAVGQGKRNVSLLIHSFFNTFLLFALVFLFAACSKDNGRFRMEGSFKNLNQGEFYIYSLENGTKDTIAVNDGHFVYERQMTDTLTLVMLFPNYSEIPIFARPNIVVKMEGDATHLKETTVTGSPENDAMTTFRTTTSEKMPPEVLKEAKKFINDNPKSNVSVYLLQKYLLQTPTPDYQEALKLCAMLHRQQPGNIPLARLHTQLEGLKNYKTEGQLPAFKAKAVDGTEITNGSLKSQANVIVAWATWSSASQSMITTLNKLRKDNPGKVQVVSICMNGSHSEGKSFLERDSISWPDICDGEMWQSPLVASLGISTIPANIIVDSNGKIVGRNLSLSDMKKKVEGLVE